MEEKRREWTRGMGELRRQRRGWLPGSESAASTSQQPRRKAPKRGQVKLKVFKGLLSQIVRRKNIFEADAYSETDSEDEMLLTPNGVEADLSNQEIQVENSDDNVFEQDGLSLMDLVEANADSENYLEHEILWTRNDVDANLGGQENEVTTSDVFEFEQDQANRDSSNHDGLSLMNVVEANADSDNYSEHEILWTRNDVDANLGGQENEVTTGDVFEFEQDQANRDSNNHDGLSLMDVLAWVFPITNFTLELPSAVLDQLSSVNQPRCALILMLISFIALMACIGELIYKGKNNRVTWQWRGRVPWFSGKPFDNTWEIIGFASAFLQCVVTAINYSFVSRHADGPIKTATLPILFAFGLLCSKYFEKPDRNRGGNPDGDSAINLLEVRVE